MSVGAAIFQELVGCEWGRGVTTPDDREPCAERAIVIVVVHDGDAEAGFKLCSRHRDRIFQETTPRPDE
jgi:hypothetical protein